MFKALKTRLEQKQHRGKYVPVRFIYGDASHLVSYEDYQAGVGGKVRESKVFSVCGLNQAFWVWRERDIDLGRILMSKDEALVDDRWVCRDCAKALDKFSS